MPELVSGSRSDGGLDPVSWVRGLARACHPLPAVAVTAVISAFGWSIGWRGWSLLGLGLAVVIGQLSVGWSNDAFDARLDARVGRAEKPSVAGLVSVRLLWTSAIAALVVSCALSWSAAGAVGGSFHVLSLAMAWTYNLALSRTVWSWVPYAVAFGAVPPFLTFGLDGQSPPAWTVAVFGIVGVSAHLANALPDVESDRSAGVGGLAVRLGARASSMVCWVLLAVGTSILVVVTASEQPFVGVLAAVSYLVALVAATRSRRRSAAFHALLVVVAVDVMVLIVASGS